MAHVRAPVERRKLVVRASSRARSCPDDGGSVMTWSRESVASRVREAWDTLRRVPSHRVPGFRVSWPDFVRDVADAYGYTAATVRLARASPQAIDRMQEVFGWFAALDGRPHLTKAVWLCAGAGMGPKRAGMILGVHRDTMRARRDDGLDGIADALNRRQLKSASGPEEARMPLTP